MKRFVVVMTCALLAVPVAGLAADTSAPPAPAAASGQELSLATVHALYASSIVATGRVQSLTSARLGPRVSGRLEAFGKAADGQTLDVGMPVKAGQILFELDKTTFRNNLALTTAQLESAKAALKAIEAPLREEKIEQLKQELSQLDVRLADKTREQVRYKQLVEQEKTLPPRRLEEAEVDVATLTAQKRAVESRLLEAQRGGAPVDVAVAAARVKEAEAAMKIAETDLRDATVIAPFDGVVTQRFKSAGDYLVNMPPTDVLEIVSLDRLEAEVAVPESYLPALQSGSPRLALRSPLLRQQLDLSITRIVGHIDPAKGTFNVRVAIPADQRQGLIPGAFVTADLPLPQDAGGIIAPARAIAYAADKTFVYVARDGKMVRQTVELGDKLSEGIIITAGLREGDKIVLGPAEQLADGRELPAYLK